MPESFLGNAPASVREPWAIRGKHRTEVTEATEGELEWVPESFSGTSGGSVREDASYWGKHRTEVTEATEGELGWDG